MVLDKGKEIPNPADLRIGKKNPPMTRSLRDYADKSSLKTAALM